MNTLRDAQALDGHPVWLPKDHFICANCRELVDLDDYCFVSSKSFKGIICVSHKSCYEQTINFMRPIIDLVKHK